jgi:hypothetical protein
MAGASDFMVTGAQVGAAGETLGAVAGWTT